MFILFKISEFVQLQKKKYHKVYFENSKHCSSRIQEIQKLT